MGISWQDRIPNWEVLHRANMQSVEAILVKSQLRWAGHVKRMPDDRLPKAVMYGELTHGKRRRGGQKLRFKDVMKRHLIAADLDPDTWESKAANRPAWRKVIHDAGNEVERKRKEKYLAGCMETVAPLIFDSKAFIDNDGQPMMMMIYIYIEVYKMFKVEHDRVLNSAL